ncbi:MAG: hypothetical protein ACE5R4_08350 [Armatimonadota bacterium]
MLDERYLLLGVNALSRAHATDYFADGHRGAAIVSACYLCRENDVEDGVPETIAAMIDANWAETGLCAPFPDEEPDASLVGRIGAALERNIGRLRQAGHNVIFPAVALKALADLPEAVTPSRVEGVCRLIEAFQTAEDITLDEEDETPDFGTDESMSEFILAEMLRTMQAFDGRGQGWSGHMLTYGRALVDLRQLGWAELAGKGHHAFRLYVKRTRMGPLETDIPRPEHRQSELRPLELEYWRRREGQDVGIGHCFKYPYGFYGLMELARDGELKQRCLEESYRIF